MLLNLLKEFKEVFAWTYVEMPGLDQQVVMHKLNTKEGIKLVKQALKNFRNSDQTEDSEVFLCWFHQAHPILDLPFQYVPLKEKKGQIRCW